MAISKSTNSLPKKRAADTKISPRAKRISYKEDSSDDDEQILKAASKKVRKSSKTSVAKNTVKAQKRTASQEADDTQQLEVETRESSEDPKIKANGKSQTKRKSGKVKVEDMPLAARTIGPKILVGAHISIAGGIENAVVNSIHIGGNAFALFLKSQRKWANPALQEANCLKFLDNCKLHKYGVSDHTIPPIVPHGSYLVNLAHPEPSRAKQAYDSFLDDLDRCRRLGIRLYNFHPGNAAGAGDMKEAIKHLGQQLNKAHKNPASGNVITLLETMAAPNSNTIGTTFEQLKDIIDLIEDKERVGVCLDTCHVFAAGYDLRTPEAFGRTMQQFDDVIGLNYLKAIHLNDSKAPLGSGRDLHANIGTGFLGLRAFWSLANEQRLWGLPLVLETPIDVKDPSGKMVEDKGIWAQEIKLLERLVGMDAESKEFKDMEASLQTKGKAERVRIQEQVDRRNQTAKGKGKRGAKKKHAETSDEDASD